MFFWAPMMKWCLVGAGLKDLQRPAEKLSLSQNVGELPHQIHRSMPWLTLCYPLSFSGNRIYLGPVFSGHYTSQLQSGCGEFYLLSKLSFAYGPLTRTPYF